MRRSSISPKGRKIEEKNFRIYDETSDSAGVRREK